MKVLKYKKLSSGKYKVFFDDSQSHVLHEDIILKYDLLLKKEISNLDEIIKDNNNYLIYDNVLKYINTKMRCECEIRNYLIKKDIENSLINEIIVKLKENGLIDDRNYAKSYIYDKVKLNKLGPNKIKSELLKLKIDENIINEEMENIDSDEANNNLIKLIDKMIKSNRSYSGDVLKQKILSDLINKGYFKEDILNILNGKDLTNEELYKKEYKKLENKYSKKYSGNELEYYINQKLYQKGFKKMQ